MLRPARFVDVPRMVEMLVEQQQQAKIYADVEVDQPYTRRLLAQFVQRHGGIHDGATCLFVVESDKGVIEAFCAGVMTRVYEIGTLLCAKDAFLVATKGANPRAALQLIDAYVAWADMSPKCYEINLSRTDILSSGARMDKIYIRKGFEPCGRIFRKLRDVEEQRIAA